MVTSASSISALGAHLQKLVSDRLGSNSKEDIHDVIKTALSTMAVLGLLACTLLIATAPLIAEALKLGASLRDESVLSLRILALGIPFVILSPALLDYWKHERSFMQSARFAS
ncbi:hypothetical protein C7E24_21655 [Stenotrophomonas maltophilia]|nr:hypothetical protein C7E24_21655 [Stenotrophomonas maltophilia]